MRYARAAVARREWSEGITSLYVTLHYESDVLTGLPNPGTVRAEGHWLKAQLRELLGGNPEDGPVIETVDTAGHYAKVMVFLPAADADEARERIDRLLAEN